MNIVGSAVTTANMPSNDWRTIRSGPGANPAANRATTRNFYCRCSSGSGWPAIRGVPNDGAPRFPGGRRLAPPSVPCRTQLLALSAATLDRLLQPLRVRYPGKGLAGPKPGTLLKHHLPVRPGHWDITRPGFIEADTVAHGGSSLAGNFVWSLVLTDIFSGWTQLRAVWNKGAAGSQEQIADWERQTPFARAGFDCDKGSAPLKDR